MGRSDGRHRGGTGHHNHARVIDLLHELDLADDTLVIFTSDNGPMAPKKVRGLDFSTRFNSNGPFRGYKRDIEEGGIRAPMIAWWPGTVPAGAVTDHPSAHYDFLATAADLAGVEATPTDGISYRKTLLGEQGQEKHEFLYWEDAETGKIGIRKGRWKGALQGLKPGAKQEPWEVYDLRADLGETKDLSAEMPEKVNEFKRLMSEARVPSARFPLEIDG